MKNFALKNKKGDTILFTETKKKYCYKIEVTINGKVVERYFSLDNRQSVIKELLWLSEGNELKSVPIL